MTTPPLLVTGAAGFVGARFVESCSRKGIPLISVDKLSHFASRAEHRGLSFGIQVDREELFDWLNANQPAVGGVVHLGACTDTTEYDEEFLERVNTAYSQKLWNYCSEHGLPFVYASSAATYGAGELGYDDNEAALSRLKPLNPYGTSKHRFDLWALAQENAGNKPKSWAGFKFFNVYGYGERHKGKMSSLVIQAYDQIGSTGKLKLFKSHKNGIADGDQKRDFIYVDDVVSVLEFALAKPISRGIYNLGTGRARSFADLARAAFAAMGKPEQIDYIDMPLELRERYQYFTEAKMERLKAQGYSAPFRSVEEGVRLYIERLKKQR